MKAVETNEDKALAATGVEASSLRFAHAEDAKPSAACTR